MRLQERKFLLIPQVRELKAKSDIKPFLNSKGSVKTRRERSRKKEQECRNIVRGLIIF